LRNSLFGFGRVRSVKNLFKTNNEINGRQTRHGEYNLVCPKYNYATEGGKSVTVSSIKIWNNLPKDIKTKLSVNSFKVALKKYFLEFYKGIGRFDEGHRFFSYIAVMCFYPL
jgi:hypothetical protein